MKLHMKIGIISTGSELLRGIIADTNAAWMAAQLDAGGYQCDRIVAVSDELEELTAVLQWAFGAFDLVVVGGGLGPTDDDITAQAAAQAGRWTITRQPDAAEQVRARFEHIGRPMVELNLKQADLPDGCRVLENRHGTAPGFSVKTERGQAFFLPGVPSELKPMFETYVLGPLPRVTDPTLRVELRCFGRGESDIQQALKPIEQQVPGVGLSFRASFPEIGVTVNATDCAQLERAVAEVRRILGKTIFATGAVKLPAACGQVFTESGLTVATAESCTGGLIGHLITEVPGSSAYFRGGVIAYDNAVKIAALGVDPAVLEAHGAVSEPVVIAMAQGARQALNADIGLATSGIAGPDGGTAEKPVGLVHLAVVSNEGVVHKQRLFSGYGRDRVKQISAWAVLRMAFDHVKENR